MNVKKAFVFSVVAVLAAFNGIAAADFGMTGDIDGMTFTGYGVGTSSIEGGFNVYQGQIHYWNAMSGYHVLDTASDTVTDMGMPDEISSNYAGDPFGVYDSVANTFYAATYANGGESCLYSYSYATDSWSDQGSAVNMYGGAVHNNQLYISGLREPWSGGFDTTYVSIYDTGDAHAHDAIIQTEGASAHLAVADNGDVYYASYGNYGGGGRLYRWSGRDILGHINDLLAGDEDTFLTIADAEILSTLPAGGNGITIDEDGVVFMTVNNFTDPNAAGIYYWKKSFGAAEEQTVEMLAHSDGGFGWFGPMAIEGAFFDGAELYTSSNFNGHIVGITVPEPTTAMLLAIGTAGLIRRKRN